jgi:hypothetical protein
MNPFKIGDFVVNINTNEIHIITGLPNNKQEQSVFDLSQLVEIDGIKGMQPHYKNFRHATKEEILQWVEKKFR